MESKKLLHWALATLAASALLSAIIAMLVKPQAQTILQNVSDQGLYGASERHLDGDLSVSGTTRLASMSVDSFTATTLTSSTSAVVNTLWITGNESVSGTLTVLGNITDTAGSFPHTVTSTFAAATGTVCTVQNTSGHSRMMLSVGVVTASSTVSPGSVAFNVGTSSNSGVTSTSPFFHGLVLVENSAENVNTTSSLMSAYGLWRNNEHLVFKAVTGTVAGLCRATFQ